METDRRVQLEDLGLDSALIDEILPMFGDSEGAEAPSEAVLAASIENLKTEMAAEPDPYKRAAIAARIISLSLS